MAQLRACLDEEGCGGFQTCLASDGETHVPRVAVASLSAASLDDRCERQCGLVGDCLQATERQEARGAASLELACLEVCVGNPADSDRGKQIDACATRETCDELLSCTADAWGPAAVGLPESQGPVKAGDCAPTCQRVVNCLVTQASGGAGIGAADMKIIVDECTANCEQMQASKRDKDRSSSDEFFRCAERLTCEDVMSCFMSSS